MAFQNKQAQDFWRGDFTASKIACLSASQSELFD